ncbi:MAG: family NAD(P)-dependent oxidoreductase [Segetibacter sp.]|jgi:dTDP-4-dehydrorhamnose reductase|nr:family NAD(P)-dependent oxidoreductase [Segetibacter sp.]
MKKVLITGANGFLGQHLTCYLNDAGYEVIATGKGPGRIEKCKGIHYVPADLTNKQEVAQMLLNVSPDFIIHNAALSKPDECENDKKYCLQVNVDATNHLLTSGKCHFIYISTDFVFGEDGPHGEDAETGPLNFYGESKLLAEKMVAQSGQKFTIVRPVFIYGAAGPGMRPSFLHWVKNNLEQRKQIKVVSDQSRTPTYAEDICKGIEKIMSGGFVGFYNLAGKDILSPYEMAIKTAKVLGLDTSLIENVTAETFPEAVRRAKRSGLKIDKARRELGYDPVSFEEGVRCTFGL